MATYLLDYDILIELHDPSSVWHQSVKDAVDALVAEGHVCLIEGRMLPDLWSLLTRPAMLNGHDLSPEAAAAHLDALRARFTILTDPPAEAWIACARTYRLVGDDVRQAQLLAAMRAAGATHLLTITPPYLPDSCGIEPVVLDPVIV